MCHINYLFERFSNDPGMKCDLFWPGTADQSLGSDMLEDSWYEVKVDI